jgi:hypothetical protein
MVIWVIAVEIIRSRRNVNIAFAQSGANFFIYVYIGGQWRSASLS